MRRIAAILMLILTVAVGASDAQERSKNSRLSGMERQLLKEYGSQCVDPSQRSLSKCFPSAMQLPRIANGKPVEKHLSVVVSKGAISVDGRVVTRLVKDKDGLLTPPESEMSGMNIGPLTGEADRIRRQQGIAASTTSGDCSVGFNLSVDETVPFKLVRRVLHSLAMAGYSNAHNMGFKSTENGLGAIDSCLLPTGAPEGALGEEHPLIVGAENDHSSIVWDDPGFECNWEEIECTIDCSDPESAMGCCFGGHDQDGYFCVLDSAFSQDAAWDLSWPFDYESDGANKPNAGPALGGVLEAIRAKRPEKSWVVVTAKDTERWDVVLQILEHVQMFPKVALLTDLSILQSEKEDGASLQSEKEDEASAYRRKLREHPDYKQLAIKKQTSPPQKASNSEGNSNAEPWAKSESKSNGASTKPDLPASRPAKIGRGQVVLGRSDLDVVAGDPGGITFVINAKKAKFQECYDVVPRDDSSLGGKVTVLFDVGRGRVLEAGITANTTGNEALGECILRTIRLLRFSPSVEADVEQSFVFSVK